MSFCNFPFLSLLTVSQVFTHQMRTFEAGGPGELQQTIVQDRNSRTASLSSLDVRVLRKSLQLLAERQEREEVGLRARPLEGSEGPGPLVSGDSAANPAAHTRHSTGELLTRPPTVDFLSSSLYSSAPIGLGPDVTPAQLARIAADRPPILEVYSRARERERGKWKTLR